MLEVKRGEEMMAWRAEAISEGVNGSRGWEEAAVGETERS
jgi:hypothetical protein